MLISRNTVCPLLAATALLILISCNTSKTGFGKRSPHEKYAEGIEDAGLRQTQLGNQWFAAADKGLNQPLSISLPYKETGYFAAEKPYAAGYIFSARQGEQLVVTISTVPARGVMVFTEVWQPADTENKPKLLAIADTTTNKIEFEIEKDGRYQLRLQPELLKGIEYTLTITTAPSLAFPVRSADNPRVTSFWGAERDGGSRSHEGIDIFAKRLTPAIAASDGSVTRVNENNLGGKVIFLRPKGKNYSLYYAHLDSQIARPGQQVRAGEVIGLIGNTGNARTTAPHLHFGIYANGGAVDPFPFVNNNRPAPKNVTAPADNFNEFLRSSAAIIYSEPTAKSNKLTSAANNIVYVSAATENWYKVTMTDGREGFISSTGVSSKPLRSQKLAANTKLHDQPSLLAATKTTIPAGDEVSIIGTEGDFHFVSYKELQGWIIK